MFGIESSVLVGVVLLGFVHGIEPGHGWPVAAAYALEQSNKWLYGFAASAILGVGHLVSSVAVVVVFFLFKRYFELTQINDPVAVEVLSLGTVTLGGPVSLVAGLLLVALGVREYRGGHSHDSPGHSHGSADGDGEDSHAHGEGHARDHGGSHAHSHDHDRSNGHGRETHSHDTHSHGGGLVGRILSRLPFVDDVASHGSAEEAAERGLWGIAGFAFLLGFAHEEEFELIVICSTTGYCLELMLVYALAVVVGIVGLTLLLIAGYQRYEERVANLAAYFPLISAVVLVVMGVGFILGLF